MSKHSLKNFNPNETARLDAAMWQAYYQHRFVKMMLLLVKLMHTQFGLNWLQSIKAAYYSGHAAMDFRKNAKSKDYARPLENLEIFYAYIQKHSLEDFDPKQVAKLELEWWLVHRYPKQYRQTLEEALAHAMAALYNVKPKSLSDYAKFRAGAMHIRDVATWQTKTEPDWAEIENLLMQAYKSLKYSLTAIT